MDFLGQIVSSLIVFALILAVFAFALSHPWIVVAIMGIIASGWITFYVTQPDEEEVQ